MDDSTNMTDAWIANALKTYPCTLLDNGNIRTCPLRLSFPHIFERSKPIPPATEGKYGANLVFPVGADVSIIHAEMSRVIKAKWPNAGAKGGPKLKNPVKQQSDMLEQGYDGYGTEGIYLTCNSGRQPQAYDGRQQALTDPERIYPGVWAVATIKADTYDVGVNKGPTFYLQSIMIVADDKRLGGGGSSASDFADIQLDASVSGEGVFADDEDAAAAKLFS